MEVYLVRHAEDRAARERRFGDEGLTPRGERQARRLAAALRAVPFTRCLCSPLRRARETARLLLDARDVPLVVDPSFAEGSAGDLHGIAIEEGAARYPEDFRLGDTVVPRLAASDRTAPGGEDRTSFLRRVEAAAASVCRSLEVSDGPVLVISHGGLLNYLLQQVLRMPLRDEVPFGFEHCGVVKLVRYREDPGFGPFAMLHFGMPAESEVKSER